MEEYIITDRSRQNWLVAIITGSVLMFSIDYSMLNISLPTIAQYFNVNITAVASLPMAYLLVVTTTLLLFGKLGDIKGYKLLFLSGVAVFGVGTILCGVSPNIEYLIASRVFQSLGESMLAPAGMAIVTSFMPENKRGLSLGILATAQGLGIAIGALAGGFINSHFMWRGIFFVNIPLIAAVIVFGMKLLPAKQAKTSDTRFDCLGAVLIAISLGAFVYAMNSISNVGPVKPSVIASFIISPVVLALFLINERRVECPLLDLKFFSNMNFTFANIAGFFFTFILIGFGFLAPFYLEMARGLSVGRVGILLVIPSFTMMLFAPVSGKLADKFGSSMLCALGMAVCAVAFVMLALLARESSLSYVVLALFLLGLGAGTFLAPNNKFVLANAPSDKQGLASGVYKIFLNTGSIFGVALFPFVIIRTAMMLASRDNMTIAQIKQSPHLLCTAFRGAFVFGVFVCLAAILFSILAKDRKAAQG